MLFAAPSFKTSDYMEMVDQVEGTIADARAVGVLLGGRLGRDRRRDAAARARATLGGAAASLSPDDPINIQYTSGTTGFPKGATLTHRNILNNGYFVTRLQGFTPDDRLCIPVPFYHCFGMVMGNLGCTTQGATMVIPSDAFDPIHVLETVQAERCTALYGVPTMFIAELGHPDFESTTTCRRCAPGVMAGSPCPVEVMKACVDRMHMARRDDLLRHDRDVAGVDADAARRLAAPPHGDGRPGAPPRRDPRRRPGDRRDPRARRRPASSAPAGTR